MGGVLIVYYSRTGTSKRVAEWLADKLDAQLEAIEPINKFGGAFGAARGALATLRGKEPLIVVGEKTGKYERVVLVTPIWASHIAAPALTWLSRQRGERQSIDLVTVSASDSADGAPGYLTRAGVEIRHVGHIRNKDLDARGADEVLSPLLS